MTETREMTTKETVQAIMKKRPEVTEQQVLEALKVERNKTGGLIADETLLRLMAVRYGVEIPSAPVAEYTLSSNHLVPSLNNITISGRVVAVYPAKAFEGEKPGKYGSLMIADRDGLLRVMLWNDKADLVESNFVKVGHVVRFSHGYTRDARNGKVELHISEKAEVEVDPEDLQQGDYPSIERFITAIKDVTLQQQSVHLVGRVKTISPSSKFTRQDQSVGTVLRFTIEDQTGNGTAVAWNGKAEKLEALLKPEMEIKLVNAKVKPAPGSGLEVHVDESTYTELSAFPT